MPSRSDSELHCLSDGGMESTNFYDRYVAKRRLYCETNIICLYNDRDPTIESAGGLDFRESLFLSWLFRRRTRNASCRAQVNGILIDRCTVKTTYLNQMDSYLIQITFLFENSLAKFYIYGKKVNLFGEFHSILIR